MFRLFANRNRYSFADIGLRCDVHSHILPGVDDGAGDFAASLEILRTMHAAGVERFVLTPHVSGGLYPNKASELKLRFDHLVATLPEDLASQISLRLGSEYMIDEFFEEQTDLLYYNNRHILVEMSYGVRSVNLLDTVFRLVQEGFTPVLAHPERYVFYYGRRGPYDVEELEQLQEMGCKFQLNIQSLSGSYGPESLTNLKYFLDHDWYSYLASDIHAARQMARYTDFQVSPAQFEKVRELASNNEMLF